MDDKTRELMRSIMKRAMEEGRQGRVRMIHERLRAAREIPDDHRQILLEIELFGRVLPKSPWQSTTMH